MYFENISNRKKIGESIISKKNPAKITSIPYVKTAFVLLFLLIENLNTPSVTAKVNIGDISPKTKIKISPSPSSDGVRYLVYTGKRKNINILDEKLLIVKIMLFVIKRFFLVIFFPYYSIINLLVFNSINKSNVSLI